MSDIYKSEDIIKVDNDNVILDFGKNQLIISRNEFTDDEHNDFK